MKSSARRPLARALDLLLVLVLVGGVLPPGIYAETVTPPAATATPARPARTATPAPTATPPLPATLPDLLVAGDDALRHSNFARAEAAYHAVLELDAGSAAAHAGLSRTLVIQMGRVRDALAEAQQAVKLDPAYFPGWLAQAEAEMQLLRSEAALASAEEAARLVEDAAEQEAGQLAAVQSTLARAYVASYRFDDALAAAEQAVTLEPDSANAYGALANVHWGRYDMGRAALAFQKASELEPEFVWWRQLLGDLYAQMGETALSTAEYDRILKRVPDYGYAQIGMAWREIDLGNNSRAVVALTKLRDANPAMVEPRRALADVTRYTQGSDKAIARYQDALRLNPADVDAKLGLVRSLYETGDCARAETQVEMMLKERPRDVNVLEVLSNVRWCLGDAAGALRYAEQITDINPYFAIGHIRTADLLLADGKTDPGVDAYLRSLRLGYRDGQEHYAFGQVFEAMGDLSGAEQEYAWSASLWPTWSWPPYALCNIYIEQDRSAEARDWCGAAYGLDPTDPDLARQYAWMLLRGGQPQDALDVLTRLVDTSDVQTQLYLGITHYMMGRYPAAIEAFNRYMKLNRGDEPDIETLIAAMEEGYTLKHQEALALASEGVVAAIGRPATVGFEEKVGRRGPVVEVTGQPGEKTENVVLAALRALIYLGQIAPRMSPVVNGAHVRAYASDGEPLFAAFVGVGQLREQMTGLATVDQFLRRVDYESPDTARGAWSEEEVRELGSRAEEVRELKAVKPVPFEGITQAEVTAELKAQADEDIEALKQDEAVLRLLGTIDRSTDLAKLLTGTRATELLGYYDPVEKAFVYVTDKAPSAVEELTIIHEYVHALQDQHFTLALPTTQVDDDRRLAYRALVEGDAELAQQLYSEDALGLGDLLAASSVVGRLNRQKLDEIPPVIRHSLSFPYNAGLTFVAGLYERGGLEAVNRAFAAPPRSTEQVLHVDKYLSGEQPVNVKAPALPASLKETWRVADSNVLGEFGWIMALQNRLGPMAGVTGGMGWGGDRYTLFQKGDGGKDDQPDYMLAAVTAWDTEEDAREFAEMYASGLRGTVGVNETTADLLSPQPVRTYKERDLHTALRLKGKQVAIVIGSEQDAVMAVLEGVK